MKKYVIEIDDRIYGTKSKTTRTFRTLFGTRRAIKTLARIDRQPLEFRGMHTLLVDLGKRGFMMFADDNVAYRWNIERV